MRRKGGTWIGSWLSALVGEEREDRGEGVDRELACSLSSDTWLKNGK